MPRLFSRLFRSKVTALIYGKSHQLLHLCGVNTRAMSSLNPDYQHYRLCSCGLSQTETHILLVCDLTRAPRQVMLNSIRNILLKEQVFTLSQLKKTDSVKLHGSVFSYLATLNSNALPFLQLYDAVCDFLQQLWRICNDSLRAQHSLLMMYYHFFFFASLFITVLLLYLRLRVYMLNFCHHVVATGPGRWHSRLWPAVVCR